MGYFDILYYKVKCPKCKKQREWGFQFKNLVNDDRLYYDYPKYFKVGDEVIIEDNIISGIGNCPICKTQKDVLIKIIDNKISSEYTLYDG